MFSKAFRQLCLAFTISLASATCFPRGPGSLTGLPSTLSVQPCAVSAIIGVPVHATAQSSPAFDTAQAHVGKGYEYVAQERYAEATTEFQAALAIDPQLIRARYQLAVCYFALGRRPEARTEFGKLHQETGGDPSVTYYLGRLDLIEKNLDAAIRQLLEVAASPPFVDTAYYLGSAYLAKAELGLAEKWLRKAATLDQRDFRVPDHLARVYQKEGRLQDAEREYARSAELRQRYSETAEQVVNCARDLETNHLDQARLTCQKLSSPDDPDKLTALGMLYGQHADYADAVEPLARAAQLDSDSFEIQHDLGLTYFRLKRYAEARAALQRSVELRPEFFGSNALLGATLYALKEDEMAYRVLDHAHQLDPKDFDTAELLFNAATLLAQKQMEKSAYAECLSYLRKAVELHPADANVHRRLAEVYSLLGQHTEAEFETRETERLSRP